MKNIGKSQNTYPGREQPDTAAVLVLVANAEQHFTIPPLATVALFSATNNYYVCVNGQTATVPASTVVSFPSPNTIPELNPAAIGVTAGNLMSVISPGSGVLVISFYRDTDLS